ncbi:MAG: leucine-rich repeat domain-containing protein [Bacteroidales bacterium]|nr:leucine-rich repeat domain-containing protein [Bacteroidales bacterium]
MKWLFTFLLPFFVYGFGGSLRGQQNPALSASEVEAYKAQSGRLVEYLEGTLNFLGDPDEVNKEKQIVIEESYLKIFRDEKVQIEDDLDEGRDVPLYKDVQAYLKDIRFFYRQIAFTFQISEIGHYLNDRDQHYFRVTLTRTLDGITIRKDSVFTRAVRFIEINLDPASGVLKIASIYTTKPEEKEELEKWWNQLSWDWKACFGKGIKIMDSIPLQEISRFGGGYYVRSRPVLGFQGLSLPATGSIPVADSTLMDCDTVYTDLSELYSRISGIMKMQEIDLSGNRVIRNMDPLSKLTDLRVINCSGTHVTDLFPLRNLSHLEVLNCSHTNLSDLSPMIYATSLRNLDISHTQIEDIQAVRNFRRLERLDCSGTLLQDLSPLEPLEELHELQCDSIEIYSISFISSLIRLERLDVSHTFVSDLTPLESLTRLNHLNCEYTLVTSLESLGHLEELEYLFISGTGVSSLDPLEGLGTLKRIYCDNTRVSAQHALRFMRNHPGCLVVFESDELLNLWQNLGPEWKEVFRMYVVVSDHPGKEELHDLLRLEKLDLSGHPVINNLEPVRKLYNLKELNASGIGVSDIFPLSDLLGLEILDLSNTSISELDALSGLRNLMDLNIANTGVPSLAPLSGLPRLRHISADKTPLSDAAVFSFRADRPDCLVVYKTYEMNRWWETLSRSWQNLFASVLKMDSPPTPDQLHQLLFLNELIIKDHPDIHDLTPLTRLKGLKKISLISTAVTQIQPLSLLQELGSLTCSQCPLQDLSPVMELHDLTYLNVENTSVSDLSPLSQLSNLESLIISGTQVRDLKSLSAVISLRLLECSNTGVKKLKPLYDLPALISVKCFNTRISDREVQKFRESKPDCEILHY